MQRKCKTCGAIAFVGYSDPDRKESWLASACDAHRAEIERDWLQWCSDNGRRVLPPECRQPENRDIDDGSAKGAGAATEQPRSARGGKICPSADDTGQGALF